MTVNVLGSDYTITIKKYKDEPSFEDDMSGGYCRPHIHEIVICDMTTYPGWEHESKEACVQKMKQILRHEIVHAFFYESGLSDNTSIAVEWAANEEMVDWISLQGPKIYDAWRKVGAL